MEEIPITDVLDLHPFAPRDVKTVVEEYLFQCVEKGFRFVRIIHGKGIGVQREMVRSILAKSDYVESFEEGPNWGSTAVILTAKPPRNKLE
ncbi:Smr/MutS family protein [bacterium]|nr:Smr/MutS family protein [bacterium]